MGLLGLAVVCAAGIWRNAGLEETLLRGLVALLALSGVGFVLGLVGAAIMRDATKTEISRLHDEANFRGGVRRDRTESNERGKEAATAGVSGSADETD